MHSFNYSKADPISNLCICDVNTQTSSSPACHFITSSHYYHHSTLSAAALNSRNCIYCYPLYGHSVSFLLKFNILLAAVIKNSIHLHQPTFIQCKLLVIWLSIKHICFSLSVGIMDTVPSTTCFLAYQRVLCMLSLWHNILPLYSSISL